MTAEIAVLNKAAVALATDSAVTIRSGGGPARIYNSANKLFTLSKYYPVGVMIYGNVEFMGVPWETIIKAYRETLGRRSSRILEEYADDFIAFLDSPNAFVSEDTQDAYVAMVARSVFENIAKEAVNEAKKKIKESGEIKNDAAFIKILKGHIRREFKVWKELHPLPHLPKGHARTVVNKYKKTLANARKEVFKNIPLETADVQRLNTIVGNVFCRDFFPSHSGIVVAGFGQDDIFPALKAFKVECHVAGRLKYLKVKEHSVAQNKASIIIPFAQADMVHTFMQGASQDYIRFQEKVWREGLDGYAREVMKRVGGQLDKAKKNLKNVLGQEADKWIKDARTKMTDWRQKEYVHPVMDMVAVLPKDELADMAEALVNLTSFKRHVTRGEEQTVGGPIDVAVISKGDGFIWIKRKHYFSTEHNPHFCARYFERNAHEEEKG